MYFVYILRCADQTLYVGFTNDLKRRLHQHNHAKQGAHYTKTRRPVMLVYFERFRLQRKALQREYEIKTWPRAKKLALIAAKKKRTPRAKSLTAQQLQDDKNDERHADAATAQPD